MSFPVFEASSRRTVQNWATAESSAAYRTGTPTIHLLQHSHSNTHLQQHSQQHAVGGVRGQGHSLVGGRHQIWRGGHNKGGGRAGPVPTAGDQAGVLPPELSSYSTDQVKLVCLSQVVSCGNVDAVWRWSMFRDTHSHCWRNLCMVKLHRMPLFCLASCR